MSSSILILAHTDLYDATCTMLDINEIKRRGLCETRVKKERLHASLLINTVSVDCKWKFYVSPSAQKLRVSYSEGGIFFLLAHRLRAFWHYNRGIFEHQQRLTNCFIPVSWNASAAHYLKQLDHDLNSHVVLHWGYILHAMVQPASPEIMMVLYFYRARSLTSYCSRLIRDAVNWVLL